MSQYNEQIINDVMNAAEYQKIELSRIIPAPYNPRVDLQPEDPEYQTIKKSILDHGFIQPIVYNKRTGNAVGGNQRLKILKELGIEETICAVIDVPLIREMEISVALNRHDNLWDREKLREIMLQFRDEGYDATSTGFDQNEIASLTQEMNLSISGFFDEEDTPAKEKAIHTYKCPFCGETFEK